MAVIHDQNENQLAPKEGVLIAVIHDKNENRFDLKKLEALDNASPFDIMDSTNSVNGQQYAAKMPGFSHYNNLESLKYHAYIKEGDKLRPMTMKEIKESETLQKILEDVKRFNETSSKWGRPIKRFQIVGADYTIAYDMDAKFLKKDRTSDSDKSLQETYQKKVAKKNGLTPSSRKDRGR